MKILVTGGAGYIGSVLTPMLLDQGYEVTVFDQLIYQQTSLLSYLWHPQLKLIKGDVRDFGLMRENLKEHDVILALAAWVGAPLCATDPTHAEQVNLHSIRELCRNLSKDQLLLYPCTNSGYGIGQKTKFCTEESPLRPISAYGQQKVAAEEAVLEKGGISFRLATVFGLSPRMRLDLLVNDFTHRAYRDGFVVLFDPHFKRNYLHVRDASRVFIHGIQNYSKMKAQAYNVGISDANFSKLELCEVIREEFPKFVFPIDQIGEDPDQRDYVVSNVKIENTGFRTQFSLRAGIRELAKGMPLLRQKLFANV